MSRPVRPAAGDWWRFDRYELRDGYIVPAKRARLVRYNPWAQYWLTKEGNTRDEQQPPYVSLLGVLGKFRALPSDLGDARWEPDTASETALLSWCAEHGLLGVLLHLVESVQLAPRMVTAEWAAGPVVTQYDRFATGWRRSLYDESGRHIDYSDDLRQWRDFCASPIVPNATQSGYVIAARNLADPAPRPSRLGVSQWPEFFPSVPACDRDTFPYPMPLSEEFWHSYAEPLHVFLLAARFIETTLSSFMQSKPVVLPHVGLDVGRATSIGKSHRITNPLHRLEALTAPCRMTLGSVGEDHMQVLSTTPSLLSMFGAMLAQDLAGKRPRPRICQECDKVFISNQRTIKYCTPRCLNTATKRTYRHNRSEKKASRAEARIRRKVM